MEKQTVEAAAQHNKTKRNGNVWHVNKKQVYTTISQFHTHMRAIQMLADAIWAFHEIYTHVYCCQRCVCACVHLRVRVCAQFLAKLKRNLFFFFVWFIPPEKSSLSLTLFLNFPISRQTLKVFQKLVAYIEAPIAVAHAMLVSVGVWQALHSTLALRRTGN